MADPLPPHNLPEDIITLARMRDHLEDYLSALERNTDAVDAWLQENTEKIVVGHHQLLRAARLEKNEQKALKLLQNLGNAAGFTASLNDFSKIAEENFGKDSAFAHEIGKLRPGVPADILESLPELSLTEENPELHRFQPEPASPKTEEKKSWWSSVGSWFKNGASRQEMDDQEARAREEGVRRKWREIRSEIVSLQSDKHYYVDSFMDWVGETLSPEKPGEDISRLMEKYQNPSYVIDLAQRDYADVIGVKARALRDSALQYSLLASLLDRQEITEFVGAMHTLFPVPETEEAARNRRLLLRDFGAASFADLALCHVKDRNAQFSLYAAAASYEKKILLTDGTGAGIDPVKKIIDETLAEPPLSPDALGLTLSAGHFKGEPLRALILEENALGRTAARFDADPAKREALLRNIIGGLQADDATSAVSHVVEFREALKNKDAQMLSETIRGIGAWDGSLSFLGLWHLCYPDSSILEELCAAVSDPKTLGATIEAAVKAGIVDELKTGLSARGGYDHFRRFFEERVLPFPGDFPPGAARHVIAASLAATGLDLFREDLTRKGGWLDKVMEAPLPDNKKLEWIAVLLEPYKADIEKANILFEASRNAAAAENRLLLAMMEENLVGSNVRLDDDKIMTNLHRIANIWYNPDKKIMKYTVTGTANIFMTGLEEHDAQQILSLLKRRGNFEEEYSGLFNPALIDKFYTRAGETRVSWHRKNSGDLNADKPALDRIHARKNFLHETSASDAVYSVNADSLALIHENGDGTHLIIDKYGVAETLDGSVRLPENDRLLRIGRSFFNPDNASIMLLNRENQTLDFRIESTDFDDFLEKDDYFCSIRLGNTTFAEIEDALKKRDMIASPGGDLRKFYFNLGALGYLMYDDKRIAGGKRDVGLACRKHGFPKRSGFIRADDPDLAENILNGLQTDSRFLFVGGTLTHKNCIDDAYYDAGQGNLYLFIGNEYLEIPCDAKDGYGLLKSLAKEPGFAPVLHDRAGTPENPAETPSDVVNFNRITLLQYGEAKERVNAIAEHEGYPVNLNLRQARALFDALEVKGLEKAREAAAGTPWVAGIAAALYALPVIQIKARTGLQNLDPAAVLEKAISPKRSKESDIALRSHFGTAAGPLKAGEKFSYPAARRHPPAGPPPRKPRP